MPMYILLSVPTYESNCNKLKKEEEKDADDKDQAKITEFTQKCQDDKDKCKYKLN